MDSFPFCESHKLKQEKTTITKYIFCWLYPYQHFAIIEGHTYDTFIHFLRLGQELTAPLSNTDLTMKNTFFVTRYQVEVNCFTLSYPGLGKPLVI